MLPFEKMIEIREYIDREGGSPYAKWFNRLNAPAAAKVVTAPHFPAWRWHQKTSEERYPGRQDNLEII